MRTIGKMVWATVGVGAVGVSVGIGLMMAGDLLGRRDEGALRMAVPAPVPVSSVTAQLTPAARPAPTTPQKEEHPKLSVVEMITKVQAVLNAPPEASLAQASQAITVVSDRERLVDRHQVLEALDGNPLQLLSQTHLVPDIDGTHFEGLRVTWLADSPWNIKAGLQLDDVVTAVNGKPILDPRNAGQIFGALMTAPKVEITVKRAGQEVMLTYQMTDQLAQPNEPAL